MQIHNFLKNQLVSTLGLLSIFMFTPITANAEEGMIHHLPAQICATCHQEIYEQWKGSMHAQSTALSDPIHGTFYKKVMGDPRQEGLKSKKGKFPVCLQCHAPNAARDKKTKLDAMLAYSEGVNCVACHTLKKFKGTSKDGKQVLGLKAYELSSVLQGPNGFSKERIEKLKQMIVEAKAKGDLKDSPHIEGDLLVMEQNTMFKSSAACMGCHDKRKNGKGVPLCATGDEYAASNSQVDCLACHMAPSNGKANHRMGGGHDKSMLQRSVALDMQVEANNDTLQTKISIRNRQPHSLPTGAPFRNMYLVVSAYDVSGKVIWSSTKGHPKDDDSQAYFMYELLGDDNMHSLPPTATKLGPDNRLKPFETRGLNYSLPSKGVARVNATLYYNLLWAGLVKKFTHLPKDLTAPVEMAAVEVKL